MKIYFDSKNNNSFSNFTLGPNLPFPRKWSTMVSSPTERGVVVIGGRSTTSWNGEANDFSDYLIELSGDSIGSLTWTILDQRLQYGAFKHVSFQITQAVNDCLEKVTNELRKTNRFVPDKEFSGTDRSGQGRSGPVQFEEEDPFGLDQFLDAAKGASASKKRSSDSDRRGESSSKRRKDF